MGNNPYLILGLRQDYMEPLWKLSWHPKGQLSIIIHGDKGFIYIIQGLRRIMCIIQGPRGFMHIIQATILKDLEEWESCTLKLL